MNKIMSEHMGDTRVAPAVAIGAIALDLAVRYHDASMVKDGALYQQYKIEGRELRSVDIDVVFETAIRIEQHLLATSERIATLVIDALTEEQPLGQEETGQEVEGTE